ncbi:catalase family peroxidase [Metapseudomonas resinovorans]|uniref:Catalase-related peroxidase n=1 Tax=Metapseudomonas resinovorans NBRC 106553 TaxID=1245471 RepID=S6AIH8_METRE|nr:catalase family peroxidase [Pseudomonas resinovorans]BAN48190.1 putative catalase [Pseudomonas resinovorans NBRC 106553]
MSKAPPKEIDLAARLALIGLAVGGLAAGFAYAAGWIGGERLTPQRIIDTFEANAGKFPGYRKNHAKGICIAGHFESSGEAAGLSRASVFAPGTVPVIGRLAIGGSNPHAPDAGVPVRSMALLFQLPGGEQWRTAMNTPPVLPVATPEAFYEQVLAGRPDPATGKPDPAKMQAFFAAHPESAAFRQWAQGAKPSNSFANIAYNGINAFRLVDAAGNARYVRWSVLPEAPFEPLGDAGTDPDFLSHDLQQRLAQGPLRWRLVLTLAEPGDPTDDATRQWPAERRQVNAGTLVVESAEAQANGACRDINYDPLVLPDGIQASGDPILAARSAAYAVSYNRRTREGAPQPETGVRP